MAEYFATYHYEDESTSGPHLLSSTDPTEAALEALNLRFGDGVAKIELTDADGRWRGTVT